MAEIPESTPKNGAKTLVCHLAILVLVAVLPRALAVLTAVAPARDSFRFIRAAQTFDSQPFLDAVRSINVHPLYPLGLLFTRKLFTAVTQIDGAYAWFYAGQLFSVVGYVAFLIASYAAGSLLWNRRIALWGCLGISIVPRQVFYAADVLSDSLHAALWMSAFAFMVFGWKRRSSSWLAMSGFLAALAYLTRVEAVLLPLTFIAGILTCQVVPSWRLPWLLWVRLAASFLIAEAALAVPYALTIGNLSPRSTAMVVVGAQVNPTPLITQVPEPPPVTEEQQVKETSPPASPAVTQSHEPEPLQTISVVDLVPREYTHREGYERAPLWLAVLQLGKEIGQETRGWLLALAVLALATRKRTQVSMPEGLFVLFAIAGCWAMLVLLRMRAGFIAGRYMTPVLPLLSMYAMTGVESAWHLLKNMRRLPWERSLADSGLTRLRIGFLTAVVLLAAGILCVPGWFKPLHRYRFGHMLASAWLRNHTEPTDVIFDTAGASSFFADRHCWTPDGPVEAHLLPRYAVIDPTTVYRDDYSMYNAVRLVNERGKLVATFPRRQGSSEIGIFVFDMGEQQVTRLPQGQVR